MATNYQSPDGKYKTQLIEIPIEKIIGAEWNYKEEGAEQVMQRLKASIERDGSPGVLAVRELEDGRFESIDGNHRLRCLAELQFENVRCENFGKISKADAVLIARRRNHEWFKDDFFAFAHLMRDVVVPEIDIDALSEFMPESKIELEQIVNVLNVPILDDKTSFNDGNFEDRYINLSLDVQKSVFELWKSWLKRLVLKEYSNKKARDARAFELAIIEAMNTPETSVE